MRPVIGWPVAIILATLCVFSIVNSEAVNNWVENHSVDTSPQENYNFVGIAENEFWLVVLIDFPDQNEPNGCDQNRASDLLDDSALRHIQQGIGPNSTLKIDYHSKIVSTRSNMVDYGHDENGKNDVGKNGVSPNSLAREVVESIKNEVSWEKYDLNSDGIVDRFLILHCTKPQDNGGTASSIWSHFSWIEESVKLPDGMSIDHYSIASQHSSSDLGTIIHEMYHQLGAADLYAVDDATVNQVWKGIGKWDIMASGNQNGNGLYPAIPTSPSIELMGINRHLDLELSWPTNENCVGPQIEMQGISEGGSALKIPLGDQEYIWIEYRSDSGFDSHLPGNGILVLQQDLLAGNLDDNNINSHPERAWLRVIEADGEQNMVAGNNEGEETDVFWDSQEFGYAGIEIRNRDGVLVDWKAKVIVSNNTPTIEFESESCGHSTDVDLPNYGSVLTPEMSIPIYASCEGIRFDLSSSDNREISVIDEEIIFATRGTVGVVGLITGYVYCNEGTPVDVRHEFEILGNIPLETKFEATIHVTEETELEIPIDFIGEDKQTWLLGVDGALSRIAVADDNQVLKPGDSITLDINPNGLLEDRMFVRGNLILASDSGHRYEIEVVLQASDGEISTIEEWTQPSRLVPIALALATLWVILGINSPSRKVAAKEEEIPTSFEDSNHPSFIDAFGESDR